MHLTHTWAILSIFKAIPCAVDMCPFGLREGVPPGIFSHLASETTALKAATTVLDKAASKKVVHWRTAARKISRLSLAANKM